MFQKRKKFKEEITPEKRLSDRWDQQVFFMRKAFPQAEHAISAIIKTHTKKQGADFSPSEDALLELASLSTTLRDTTR